MVPSVRSYIWLVCGVAGVLLADAVFSQRVLDEETIRNASPDKLEDRREVSVKDPNANRAAVDQSRLVSGEYPAGTTFTGAGLAPAGTTNLCTAHVDQRTSHDRHYCQAC